MNWVCKVSLIGGIVFLAGCAKHYEARFPIDYISGSGLPRTEVAIEGCAYPFVFDLGESSYCTISENLLGIIQNKKIANSVRSVDIKGNEYFSKRYVLPEIGIRNLHLENIKVIAESPVFLENTSLYQHTEKSIAQRVQEKPGRIGRRLFIENYNLLLDFYNSVVFTCCHLRHRIRDGYQIHKLVQAPLGIGFEEGIFLEVETDFGPKVFMLDTGSSHNFIRPSLVEDQVFEEYEPGLHSYNSSQFAIGGKNFGPQKLILLEMAPMFAKIDGVLGMSFLKEHVIYLDFNNKVAYVGKASEVSHDIRIPSYVADR